MNRQGIYTNILIHTGEDRLDEKDVVEGVLTTINTEGNIISCEIVMIQDTHESSNILLLNASRHLNTRRNSFLLSKNQKINSRSIDSEYYPLLKELEIIGTYLLIGFLNYDRKNIFCYKMNIDKKYNVKLMTRPNSKIFQRYLLDLSSNNSNLFINPIISEQDRYSEIDSVSILLWLEQNNINKNLTIYNGGVINRYLLFSRDIILFKQNKKLSRFFQVGKNKVDELRGMNYKMGNMILDHLSNKSVQK